MSLIKKKELKEFGIGEKEASDLLGDIIDQDEGINKKHGQGVFVLISVQLLSTRKRTINHRDDFENIAREIISKFKEKINNGNYREVAEEVLDLFRDEDKSKIRLYLENNSIVILMILDFMTLVVSILAIIIQLILAFHSS